MVTSSRIIARSLLTIFRVRVTTRYDDRFPKSIPVVLVSNHRSFLDAAILVNFVPKPLHILCHYYMSKTPILRNIVNGLGCFALAESPPSQRKFFRQATEFLQAGDWVGIFPEGTEPMVTKTKPQKLGKFYRGFASLAMRVPLDRLAIVPVAIASTKETVLPTFPIRWLKLFAPTEPLFERTGLHPMVFYHRVRLSVGNPYFLDRQQIVQYRGKQAKQLTSLLNDYCQEEIMKLLQSSTMSRENKE